VAGGAALGATVHAAGDETGAAEPLEYALMIVSVLVALIGIGLAHRFYIREPALPGRLAERFRGAYRTLYNKYWVDELYGATVIAGTRGASRWLAAFDAHVVDGIVNGVGLLTRAAAWIGGAIDHWIVDGAVNTVGRGIQWFGSGARRLQTGVIQNYVLAVFGGVIVLVVLMRFL
jgi:NADH-quinone oxidoreductase subunit L